MQREYEADVAQLRRELESRQTEIDGLKTQMRGRGRLQIEIDRLDGENKEFGQRVAEADLEIQRQRLRADELESELADSRYWRTQAEGRLERSEQALLELQRELEEARLARQGDGRVSELQGALQLAAEEREALQLRVESLQAAAQADQDLRARLRQAEERLSELRARQQLADQVRPPAPGVVAPAVSKRKPASAQVWSLLDSPSAERQESRSGGLELPGF